MGHKTGRGRQLPAIESVQVSYFVILSSIDLGSSMKVGSVTLLRSAPGRNCDMIWESTMDSQAVQYMRILQP